MGREKEQNFIPRKKCDLDDSNVLLTIPCELSVFSGCGEVCRSHSCHVYAHSLCHICQLICTFNLTSTIKLPAL